MIVKRSRRNQVAIPKKLIERAGLSDRDVFFDMEYTGGYFVLTPLEFEEKLPREALERFKAHALHITREDQTFSSMEELIAALDRKKP